MPDNSLRIEMQSLISVLFTLFFPLSNSGARRMMATFLMSKSTIPNATSVMKMARGTTLFLVKSAMPIVSILPAERRIRSS